MTTEEYQKDLDTEKPLIEFHGVLMQIPFYLSPKDNEYPLDILDNLGEYPIKVTEEEISLTILYPIYTSKYPYRIANYSFPTIHLTQ